MLLIPTISQRALDTSAYRTENDSYYEASGENEHHIHFH